MTGYITSASQPYARVELHDSPEMLRNAQDRACSISIPRSCSSKSRNIRMRRIGFHFFLSFDTVQAPDLLQASPPVFQDLPHAPPRFEAHPLNRHVTSVLAIKARLDPNRSINPQSIGKPKPSQLAIIFHHITKTKAKIGDKTVLIVICPSRPVLSCHPTIRARTFARPRSPFLGALSCHQDIRH